MRTNQGARTFGDRLCGWLRRTQPTEPFTRRVELNSSDPYTVLGLPAHPAPDRIHDAYDQLRHQFSGENLQLERITFAYREICRRQGGY